MMYVSDISVPVFGISRHRILRDGKGITTLVGIKGCPLKCRYCINEEALGSQTPPQMMSAMDLLEAVRKDDLYFRATDGGITFGGGEPLMNTGFIMDFKLICPSEWRINIETSLNVPMENVVRIVDVSDKLIVDVKSLDPDIYLKYTGRDNSLVIENLSSLAKIGAQDKVNLRIPIIPGFNDRLDVNKSVETLKNIGFKDFTFLEYIDTTKRKIPPAKATERGKRICNLLKYTRKRIAEANGISLQEEDCPAKVCSGTCPKCEGVLRQLTKDFYERETQII